MMVFSKKSFFAVVLGRLKLRLCYILGKATIILKYPLSRIKSNKAIADVIILQNV